MARDALYSRSNRSRAAAPGGEAASSPAPTAKPSAAAKPATPSTPDSATPRRRRLPRPRRSWLAGALLLVALALSLHTALAPPSRQFMQADIDAAVLHTLEKASLPSPAAKAWQAIRPSVVRVRGLTRAGKPDDPTSTGSGVVIVESGLILTSLHVVAGAERIEVTFADGLESEAQIVGAQPHNDLAVLQARKLPDDLVPATLRSTQHLSPGDGVIAAGFPFGIGPSVTSGVVSGLRREYQSPEGKTLLTNLIQFDAAANPGSSGGPLVTHDGEVVGIVTAILNPSEQRVFIGIGFAVPIENAAAAVGLTPF
jgi:S1-C subfamily serine protease